MATPAASAVARVLMGVRAHVSLSAPAWQAQPLAFGRNLFVVLGAERVAAFSMPDGVQLVDEPFAHPRGAVAIAGGSVLAAGATAALRLDPGAKKPVRLPPIPWLPGTLLLTERRNSDFVWAVQTASKLFVRQRLHLDPSQSFDAAVALDGYDGGSVAVLRDGAMLYRTAEGVSRSLPEGRPHAYKTAFDAWRLLPARRVDQAWAIAPDGSVELWLVGETLRVDLHFTAGARPFDAAASPNYLALVVVDEPGDAPRSFRLLVFGNDGSRILERRLPSGPPETGNDWEKRAVEDRNVALSDTEPLVAVGGPGTFEVLKLPGGEPIFAR
jgi:hypothetical protein